METRQEQGLIARERRFRVTLLSLLAAAFVMVAALLLFLLVPFFPPQVSVFIAVALGIIAFKAPTPALVAMLLLAVPGYVYQLGPPPETSIGLPLVVIVAMAVILFIPAASAVQTGAVLGITTGAVAAMLMLTPLHFLALPMMVAIPLFRARGGKVGSTGAIVVFMALYFPLLVAQQRIIDPSSTVPLFGPLNLQAKQPASVVNLGNLFSGLVDAISMPGSVGDKQFFTNLTVYWPVGVGGRVPPLGFILTAVFVFSIASAFGAVAFFRWLERRSIGDARLSRIGPAVSLFVADIVFLLPLGVLGGPLAYSIDVNPLGLVVATGLIGMAGAGVDSWLGKRDQIVRLREEFDKTLPRLRGRLESLRNRLTETRSACARIDLAAEEGLVGKCDQELAFAAATIDEMDVADLIPKMDQLEELDRKLAEALKESFRKLCLYYDEDKRRYGEMAASMLRFGLPAARAIDGPALSQLEPLGYDAVMAFERELMDAHAEAAIPVEQAVTALEKTLRTEVDPAFRRVGIEIGRNYLKQENYEDALETLLNEMAAIEFTVTGLVHGLETRLSDAAATLAAMIKDRLITMTMETGDVKGSGYYKSVTAELNTKFVLKIESRSLPQLMELVMRVRELGGVTSDVMADLAGRINALEKQIEQKVPSGYNWGKNPRIGLVVQSAVDDLRGVGVYREFNSRMSLIGSGLRTIDEEVATIRQYGSVNEFLINYVNIEYLIEEKLESKGEVKYLDVPVKAVYAQQYLRLFSVSHPRNVVLEERTGSVRRRRE